MYFLGVLSGNAIAFAAQAFFRQYKLTERNKED